MVQIDYAYMMDKTSLYFKIHSKSEYEPGAIDFNNINFELGILTDNLIPLYETNFVGFKSIINHLKSLEFTEEKDYSLDRKSETKMFFTHYNNHFYSRGWHNNSWVGEQEVSLEVIKKVPGFLEFMLEYMNKTGLSKPKQLGLSKEVLDGLLKLKEIMNKQNQLNH